MNDFEMNLNSLLVDTFSNVLKYEQVSLENISTVPATVTEVHIIEAIGNLGSKATVSNIAISVNVSMPTATVAVKKLEKKGFIIKTPCAEDGRRSNISLTDLGRRVNKAHSIFHRKMVRNISSDFSDDEKKVLISAMKKLDEFFKEKVEK